MSGKSGLSVVRPGVQSSLQDLGRPGFAKQGLSQGGAMDLHAHCWVNKLLGNPVQTGTLEVTIGMAAFRAESDLVLAIAGADMQAQLNGSDIANWSSFALKRGQTLTLRAARRGMRAYLGVKGGFPVEPLLGSVSTVVRNRLGRILSEGDHLPADTSRLATPAHVPHRFIPAYPDEIELRIIESYQSHEFSRQVLDRFYQSVYTVSQDTDRMGVRLQGDVVSAPTRNLVSEGIALGSIQIPPDGQPIILLNDRQTLGGYPKIGCAAKVELAKLAQARPGTRVRFAPVTLEQARLDWSEFSRFFQLA